MWKREYEIYYYEINPNKLERSRFKYNVDHIYPIIEGFKNKIPPELISHKNNLQMMWWRDNTRKSNKTDMSVEEFYQNINTNKQEQ